LATLEAAGRLRASQAAVAAGLAIIYVVWGSTYLGIKLAEKTMPPLLMQSGRFLLAGVPLFLIARRRGDAAADPLGFRQWRDAAIVAAFLMLGGLGLVTLAERSVPSGVAALLIGLAPLWMALLGRVIFGTALNRTIIAGLVIGFAGVAVLAWPTGGGAIHGQGLVMLLLSPICWAFGSLYAQHAQLPKRPFVATGMEMTCACVILFVAASIHGELGHVHPEAVTTRSLVAFAYLVGIGSVIAFSAYVWLLTVAPLSLISTYAYVNPVVAVFLGWLIDGEPLSLRTLLACTVIVGGVALIVSSHRPSPDEGVTA
jgi:drug/metabolite transporter (DMT)-like permease